MEGGREDEPSLDVLIQAKSQEDQGIRKPLQLCGMEVKETDPMPQEPCRKGP